MPTEAQISANRANSELSTGPRTPEGKARVSQNAVRHGLTAKHLVIRDDEQAEFNEFQQALIDELNPQGALESLTFNELLHAAWSLQRFRRLEAKSCRGTLSDLDDPRGAALLDRLSRYQARAQRAYYRSLQELRTLQTNRALREAALRTETLTAAPALADIRILTKQTQPALRPRTTPTPRPASPSPVFNTLPLVPLTSDCPASAI